MSAASPASPRSKRQMHRRGEHADAILAAAHRLIATKNDFTTQELIREANVALKTFYRHFTSKDHLLIALLADLIQDNADAFEEQAALLPGPVERLELIVTWPLRSLNDPALGAAPSFITSQHWRLHQLYPDEVAAATGPFTDVVRRILEDGQRAGVFAPRDPERDAWLITQMVMVVYHYYAFHPDEAGRESAAADVWAFCADSLIVSRRRRAAPLVARP